METGIKNWWTSPFIWHQIQEQHVKCISYSLLSVLLLNLSIFVWSTYSRSYHFLLKQEESICGLVRPVNVFTICFLSQILVFKEKKSLSSIMLMLKADSAQMFFFFNFHGGTVGTNTLMHTQTCEIFPVVAHFFLSRWKCDVILWLWPTPCRCQLGCSLVKKNFWPSQLWKPIRFFIHVAFCYVHNVFTSTLFCWCTSVWIHFLLKDKILSEALISSFLDGTTLHIHYYPQGSIIAMW